MSWCQFVWVGIVPSNTTLCFQWFFLFWMCSTNTFSLLNNHIDLPHSHQRGNLWNLWRKLKQTLEVSEYPGAKTETILHNYRIWNYESGYEIYCPLVGNYFQMFALYPLRYYTSPLMSMWLMLPLWWQNIPAPSVWPGDLLWPTE